MVAASSKKVLLAVLVACFAIQTGLVYTDDVDLPLSAQAVEGRKLYHKNACQVCHQLWGQGGFLGPDLTNAASRVDETRLASLLTLGSGQMPAFGFTPAEIAAMRAYLEALDRPDIGRGELRLGDPESSVSPQAAFEAAVIAMAPPPAAAAGFATFRSGICSVCHFPFQTSPVQAPDLSTAVERLDDDALHEVLTAGRPARGMPPPAPAFTAAQREELIAYFRWLNENRSAAMEESRRTRAGFPNWSRLPWWEYR